MRILLSGGGTAGHINPAIAIAELIKERNNDAVIGFVGTPDGMENKLIAEARYPMYPVHIQGFRRSLSPQNLKSAYLALTAPHAAGKILANFRPQLVIGTGGYVCWPLLRAAASRGIPTALHESNAMPGLTTRKLAPYMDAIWLNFREAAALLPSRCVSPTMTGNPLRRGFSQITREEARKKLGIPETGILVLSFGGSRGAEALNAAVLAFMKAEVPKDPHLYHIHATGEKHYEAACRAVQGIDVTRCRIEPYIAEMSTYLSAADIVICRAGAMTLSELAACGKCAILVPSPFVAKDHQRKNAAVYAKKQAAVVVDECDLPGYKLRNEIISLKNDPKRRFFLQNSIKKLAVKNTNQIIYQEIELLLKKTKAEPKC